jgi:phage/plasmid-associated DNA primase
MKKPHLGGCGQTWKAEPILSATERFNAEHSAKLRSSALSDQQLDQLQWRSLRDGRLQIDYLKPDGQPELCADGKPFRRWRSSAARIAKGAPKYVSPKGNGCRLYHCHAAIAAGNYEERLNNPQIPLRITEGELKAEAATAHDRERITIALGGVSSWLDHRDGGDESQPLPELVQLPVDGRQVRLCFDSDFSKPQVMAALRKLAEWLAERGAHVLVEVLPNGLDGSRLGLDDLVHRHGAAVFLEIAAIARCPFKVARRNREEVKVWAFNPEPVNTRERNVYLFGLHGRSWRRSDDGAQHWQHWCGRHWEALPSDEQLAATIEQFAGLQQWQNRELSTVKSLVAAFRRSIEPAADGSAAAGLVPFRNGCLRLADRKLIPHDRNHGNTWSLPFDHSPAAKCDGIQAFLFDRLGDADSVAVFRAFCRAVLAGDRLKCFLELIGPSNTGKTVLASLLMAMVGRGNTASMTLQRLEDRQQRFETFKLLHRRLAVFHECDDYSGTLNNLKAITGGDAIGAEVKGGRHLDITFCGGVVLVGNGPIRASDPSGAVINRRRSLPVTRVVAAADERVLLQPDGAGGWCGELVPELPGLVNWCLDMAADDARAALARDVQSLARAEAELRILLASDNLAEWADQRICWAEGRNVQVGVADGSPDTQLFPSYLRFIQQQGNARPLSLKVFKQKLIDLLRDTLGLPLPAGDISSGQYRERGRGSVVPEISWSSSPEEPGVIRYAFMRRIGNGRERHGNSKTPVGNGWNGRNGSEPVSHKGKNDEASISPIGECEPQPVPSVPSNPQKGFGVPDPFPTRSDPFRVDVQSAKTGQWEPGWQQITHGSGSGSVLCRDPAGHSRQVERKRIRPAQALS